MSRPSLLTISQITDAPKEQRSDGISKVGQRDYAS